MPEVNNVQKFVTPAQFASYVKPLRNAVEEFKDGFHNLAASFIVEKGDTAYSVKFAVPDGKPALIYDEIEQEE